MPLTRQMFRSQRTWHAVAAWVSPDVRAHITGIKSIHHPVVGDLDLTFQAMDLPADRGLQMIVFSAEPGSPSHDALQLLSSWANTHNSTASVLEADGPSCPRM